MLEKLLELLLSAKSGVIAGVFLIGTTGALVTATVQNGVTTITVTEASPSPSASASVSPSASASPSASTAAASASPSSSASPSASPSGSPSACADQAHAAAAAVRTVNRSFEQYHEALMDRRENVRSESGRATIADADKMLKQIRQNAVEAIHATMTCKDDDEDKNEDQDKDKEGDKSHAQGNFLVVLIGNLFGQNNTNNTTTASPSPTPTATTSASPSSSPATTTLTGTDPKAIADQAVAAMKVVFENAMAQLPSPTASSSPRPHKTEGHGDSKGAESGDRD